MVRFFLLGRCYDWDWFGSVRFRRFVIVRLGRFFQSLRFDSVRFGSVRLGSVRFASGSARDGTVLYCTVRYGTVRYGTVRYGTVLSNKVTARFGSEPWPRFLWTNRLGLSYRCDCGFSTSRLFENRTADKAAVPKLDHPCEPYRTTL